MINSEIRNVKFQQGVEVNPPPALSSTEGDYDLYPGGLGNMPFAVLDPSKASCIIIDYYLYRKAGSNIRPMTGKIKFYSTPDLVGGPNKFFINEVERTELIDASGVTFGWTLVGSIAEMHADLDILAGSDPSCIMYYKLTTLSLPT